MKVIFASASKKGVVVLGGATTSGLIPSKGDYVEATDKDGSVSGRVTSVHWEFKSMDGPTVRVSLE